MPFPLLRQALALALAAAVSLGLARFAYTLLLPAMRADLGWSYATAGAMNTANAAGYLLGALAMPLLLRRFSAPRLLLAGGLAAALLLAAHAAVDAGWSAAGLYSLRLLLGAASSLSFVAGGLLAARLGQQAGARPALVLGLYYGGVGIGIVLAALGLPGHWPLAWLVLALMALAATLLTAWAGPRDASLSPAPAATERFRWPAFAAGLASYSCFGLGYIGYMTFIVTLLREQGVALGTVQAFYAILGLGCLVSSWLWAPLLARFADGRPMALLNALLATATLLPVLSTAAPVLFASGLLFGAVFLQVVASTTALVRHNLPPAAWAGGISAFTIVFAAGQIIGPTLVGFVADGGGLLKGLAVSAAVLLAGSLLALAQRTQRA